MPRKARCRCICGYPDYWTFVPEGAASDEVIVMSLDELETIRLIDKEGLTQEECAAKMGVSRTTVTGIYDSARRKLATSLIDGKKLQISGGSYRISGTEHPALQQKGPDTMRIAVTYENGNIFQHFGHTEQFKIYDEQDGKIISSEIVDTNGSGHGALAGFLKLAGVNALICGGIGVGAQLALDEADIELYSGISGSADDAVAALLNGTLEASSEANCDHHHDHDHDHDCGCGHHHHDHEHHHDHDHDCGCGCHD